MIFIFNWYKTKEREFYILDKTNKEHEKSRFWLFCEGTNHTPLGFARGDKMFFILKWSAVPIKV